jgi:hypothetical protein
MTTCTDINTANQPNNAITYHAHNGYIDGYNTRDAIIYMARYFPHNHNPNAIRPVNRVIEEVD